MQPSTLAKRFWLLLFFLIGVFYLWGLGSQPLVGPDEPRYAEVAREMLARNDFITPTLGGLPWFEKPPLLYWMMAASYRVLGVNEYAARLGPAICGLLSAAFIYWLGRNVDRNAGILARSETVAAASHDAAIRNEGNSSLGVWSALVWLSSLGAIGLSRGATFDIVLTMTVTGALACFLVIETTRRSNGAACGLLSSLSMLSYRARELIVLVGFYLFAGLSLLAKGLVGFVIIFGVIAVYYAIRRERPNGRFLQSLLWGLPLALIVAGVWYGPIIARHGWRFIDQFIIQHHFARFVTGKYHHPGPIYFYLPVLIVLSLPWAFVLVASMFSSRRWRWRGASALDRARVFCLVWLVVPVLFFSFSSSKLVAYVLPVLPAISFLVGERIDCFIKAERGHKVLRLTGAGLIVLGIGGGWYFHERFGIGLNCWIAAASPLLLVGAAALLRPQIRKPLFILIALAVLASSALALKCGAPAVARQESVRDLLAAAAARGYTTTPVVEMHTVERTAEFYAASRFAYGSDGEPLKFEGAGQVIEAARRNGGLVLCFVPIEYESQLTTLRNAQVDVIADNGRVALFAVKVR